MMKSDTATSATATLGKTSPKPAQPHSTVHDKVQGVGLYSEPLHGKPAKLMALDVGMARIGVAVCDPLQLAARPLLVIQRRSRRDDFARLARLVTEQEIAAIICGLPLNMDGSEGTQATSTRKWALRLAQALRILLGAPLPVIFWDERLSTFAAQEMIREQNLSVEEDAAAAAIILQNYLDSIRRSPRTTVDAIVLPATPATPGTTDAYTEPTDPS